MPDSTHFSSTSKLRPSIFNAVPIWLGLVALAAALLYLPGIGARDLWNPNEPLYAEVVHEMQLGELWLIPQFHGETFPEKPPLYFWISRVAARILGELNETTLRLPAALSGILLVCTCYLWVLPLAGRRRASWSAAILATTFVVFWSARQMQMDLLLTSCIWLSILGATRAIEGVGRPSFAWSLCGTGAGLALLAKGPAGAICPTLVVLVYLASERRLSLLRSAGPLWAVGCALLVAAPWFVALMLAGEREFVFELLWRQNVTRALDPWDHRQPFWYYAQYFWIDMSPWVWWLPLAWRASSDERERRLHRLCWCTIFVVLILFSLSASKRSPYIMPLAPAVAVLVASVFDRAPQDRPSRDWVGALASGALLTVFALVGGALLAGGPWSEGALATVERAAAIVGSCLLLAALIGLLFLLLRRLRAHRERALIVLVSVVYLVTALIALPAADHFKSHRPLADLIRLRVPASAPLRAFHEWDYRSNYSFYAGRAIVNLPDERALAEFWARDEGVFLVVERGRLEQARRVLGAVAPLAQRTAGRNTSYLFCNRCSPLEFK